MKQIQRIVSLNFISCQVLIYTLIWLFTGLGLHLQAATLNVNSTKAVVSVRNADSSALKKLRNDKNYNYEVVKPGQLLTWWQKLKQWLLDKILALFDDKGAAPYIRTGLIVLIAVFIIIKLLNADISRLFYKNRQFEGLIVNEIREDINSLDFDLLIEKYTVQHDYRMAVRYYYLKLLKNLNSNGMIAWRINKTNRDYVYELEGSQLYGSFDKLSSFYEYIWYGDFKVTSDQFGFICEQFIDISTRLSDEEKN